MMVRKSISTLIILLMGVSNCIKFSYSTKDSCSQILNKFANVSQNFLICTIKHAEPVTYCRKCGSDQFASVNVKYNQLLDNEECKAKYFNLDRINILEMAYMNAQSLWDAGSCSNCYDWVDGSYEQKESKATKEFFSELLNFTNCTKQFDDKKDICSNCVDNYNIVNDLYKDIQKNTNDKFCFDIRDAMNKTRLNWSHDLNCCKDRKTSLTAFIVTSTIISVLIPFVFYTSFMFFGWRRDQQQEPLIDSDIQPSASRQMAETDQRCSSRPVIANILDVE